MPCDRYPIYCVLLYMHHIFITQQIIFSMVHFQSHVSMFSVWTSWILLMDLGCKFYNADDDNINWRVHRPECEDNLCDAINTNRSFVWNTLVFNSFIVVFNCIICHLDVYSEPYVRPSSNLSKVFISANSSS